MSDKTEWEDRRLAVQAELDAAKNQVERNKMGQFATPTDLALDILTYAKLQFDDTAAIRFIDPAIGTGSFYSALRKAFPADRVQHAAGYEIDAYYGKPAAILWKDTILDVRLEDFTMADPASDGDKFNLLICNPPYVRHHHIKNEEKQRLKLRVWNASGMDVSGLAGLYCYFLGLSHQWMAEGALAGWLLPSEFMDVNYGTALKRYLIEKVTLLHVHRFDPNDVQFGDALVSSAVVWLTKKEPPLYHKVRMTYGGSLLRPNIERLVPIEVLKQDPKWTGYPMKVDHVRPDAPVLADFFMTKRGLATGNNSYFILPIEEIKNRNLPLEAFRPILPSPRYLPENEIMSDDAGNPLLERRLFLLDCALSEKQIAEVYPTLAAYLEEGKEQGMAESYICRHRSPWYVQERRPAAPFLCTYLGRSDKGNGHPFRFFLNHSSATAPNVYLMLYPKAPLDRAIMESAALKRLVWYFLNGISSKDMLNEGRVYGGGLHKLEPRELGRVPVAELAELLSLAMGWDEPKQQRLFESLSVQERYKTH